MRILKFVSVVALAAVALVGTTAPAHAARVRRQIRHEFHRIHRGVHSGTLTKHEGKVLRRRERHVLHRYQHARHTGGGISRAERRRLESRVHTRSRAIYHQAHDSRYRRHSRAWRRHH